MSYYSAADAEELLNAGEAMQLPKQYDPQAVEPRTYARWERNGYFHEEPDPARPPFIICMPPPNVTARAHLVRGRQPPASRCRPRAPRPIDRRKS